MKDKQIEELIQLELERQQNTIELIASENIVSNDVMEAVGSVLTNKYMEGRPIRDDEIPQGMVYNKKSELINIMPEGSLGKRYYNGAHIIDKIEFLACCRFQELFNTDYHVNVQPHSGAQANMAVFFGLLQPGDTVLGLSLDCGGHLTHGLKANMSGKWFNCIGYGVNEDGFIDYDQAEQLAIEHKPKLIITGFSAYSRIVDWKRFRKIADKCGAFLMSDIAHVAGLIAGGYYPSPIDYADVVTTTTHKTLRGPRGGMIMAKTKELEKKLNSAVFPGIQGGPLMHVIAGKAVAFGEALRPEWKTYCKNIIDNAKTLANTIMARGVDIVSGGTDNHCMLVDLRSKGITGLALERRLQEKYNIVCNKNSVPNDPQKPTITSGVRLGTPACTTRGFGKAEFEKIGNTIVDCIEEIAEESK